MTLLGEAATEVKEKAGSDKYNVKLIISIIPTAEDATEDEDNKNSVGATSEGWAMSPRRGANSSWGVVCSSWVYLVRGTTLRHPLHPDGATEEVCVQMGNLIACRSSLLLHIVEALEAFFLAENPHFVGARSGWTVLGNEGFLGSPGQFASYILMGIGLAFVASDLLAIFFGERKEEA